MTLHRSVVQSGSGEYDRRNVPQAAHSEPLGWLVRLFKSISTFVLIFLEQGAVHGVTHLGKPFLHIVEKIFWLSLIVIALYFSVVLSFVSWDRYQTKATVVAIEKDHYYWNTSMPSLTICPMRRIYKPYLQSYCNRNGITDQDEQNDLFVFLESLANSSYFNFVNIRYNETVDRLLQMLQIQPADYMTLIYNLTRDLTRIDDMELRVRTQSNLEYLRTYQTLTEYGICYTTNSFISSNLTASLLLTGKQLPEDDFYSTRVVHDVRFGNLFDGDITYSFIGFEPPISIFQHSPYESLNIAKFQPMTTEAHEYETFSIEIVTTKDFKQDTSISQRGCRFTYESNLTHYSIYTKDICLQECRIQLAFKLCGCIPHFYPNPAGPNKKRVCHYKQLIKCFPRYQKLFLEFKQDNNDKKGIPCYCEQNCVGSKVIIENRQSVLSSSEQIPSISTTIKYNRPTSTANNPAVRSRPATILQTKQHEKHVPVLKQTQKLIGSIGGLVVMKRYPLVRFSRQLLFTFTDLLVSIGGTAGFFLGFSVLGMVEILYFFTLRLLWYIVGRR